MEEELKCLIKVGVATIISVSYCYLLPPKIKPGVIRLVSILPVCALFLVLPLFFSYLVFSFITLFFLGVANLRLILFSFDQGPLFPLPSNLFQFTCFTCFPIQRQQQNPKSQDQIFKWIFPVKVAIFLVLLQVYNHRQNFPPTLLLILHPLNVYLSVEIFLAILRNMLTIILGCDLEPHFNEPYLATSLQDFWGRRWNLIVSATLRESVYMPVRRLCQGLISSQYATLIGVFATFIFSGVAHEVVFLYQTREMPTGEVTLFFVLHGVCTTAEVALKRTAFMQRWSVRPVVSWLLTIAFVSVTSVWLFFPQLIRSNVTDRCSDEIFLLVDFFTRKLFNLFP
uniref:Putative long-chain-alcohol O-fatty-acyltransferase 7 n=1 Tax=Noccaea caerulescens TaxID=107243 RepID=A0A1J3K8V4_NOCCA